MVGAAASGATVEQVRHTADIAAKVETVGSRRGNEVPQTVEVGKLKTRNQTSYPLNMVFNEYDTCHFLILKWRR